MVTPSARAIAACVVLDVGKTNVKLTALDAQAQVLKEARRANTPLLAAPYRQHDVEGIWDWLTGLLQCWSREMDILAIVPVTHGATAALVDDTGLVLPVQDYEAEIPLQPGAYEHLRPDFEDTCSPALAAGLNLGRQLFWQQRSFPEAFRRVRHILMYPQYWAWRLSGVAAGELTSLGCHTDLWQPARRAYSLLVRDMGWDALLPPLQAAGATLGPISPALAQLTGIAPTCRIVCGIHDSNASLLRHLRDGDKTVLSTGTWVIAAALGASGTVLDEQQDMLANVNARGQPVSCMRFMGGREFEALAGVGAQPCSEADLAHLIARQTMAVPCFAEMGGPFSGRRGRVLGPAVTTPGERYALATLYCALMTDYCLDRLAPGAPVVVEGSFSSNPYFARLLAALHPQRPVTVSDDTSGTTIGGWMLATGLAAPNHASASQSGLRLPSLDSYARHWRAVCTPILNH